MRVLFGLSALMLIGAVACFPSPTPPRPTGIFNVADIPDGAGGYSMKPSGVFFAATNIKLPNSTNPVEDCIDQGYAPPDTTPINLWTSLLNAGSPIMVQTNLSTGNLTPDTIPNVLVTYRNHGPVLLYTPGADVTFTVPGAAGGFDASAITGKTAKPLNVGPIDPAPADSLHLTWILGTPGTTAINMQLIYASPGALDFNRQIICQMNDDGEFYVPDSLSVKWKAASITQQKVIAVRYVTTYATTSNGGLLLVIGEFDTTKTTFP